MKTIGKVIRSEDFLDVSQVFVEKHKHMFEFSDENKLEYTTLFEQYVELMENTLSSLAKEVNMEQLVMALPEFMQARAHSNDPEQTGETIDFLLSLTDFEHFRAVMLSAKLEDSTTPLVPFDYAESTSRIASALTSDLQLNPLVLASAQGLLNLIGAEAAVDWKKLAEQKGKWMLESAQIEGVDFMRSTSIFSLTVEHTVKAIVRLDDPELPLWDSIWGKIEFIEEGQYSASRFFVVKVQSKLPGVLKFFASIPKFFYTRVDILEGMPKPGSTLAIFTTWDTLANAPDQGKMKMVRVASIEAQGSCMSRMVNIHCLPPALPIWAASLLLSNTMLNGMQQAAQKYKTIKGIA